MKKLAVVLVVTAATFGLTPVAWAADSATILVPPAAVVPGMTAPTTVVPPTGAQATAPVAVEQPAAAAPPALDGCPHRRRIAPSV
jgi:hypothetical protein